MQRISILLAVHNGAEFIGDAIQSVAGQTYADWELIVVSNGSTDDTARMCREQGAVDARIRTFVLPEKGKNRAYNFAYRHATGAYICFYAADDLLQEESLAQRLRVLEGKPATAYSTCCLRTLSADPKYDGIVFPRRVATPNHSGGAVLFSRHLAERVFPLPEMQPNEDTWTSLHLRAFGENHHVPRALYGYRIHENNSYGYGLSFAHKRREYLRRMHAYQLFYDRYKGQGFAFLDREVVPFLEGLRAAHDRKVGRLLLVRGLRLGHKMVLMLYCSRILYGMRRLYFRALSGGIAP